MAEHKATLLLNGDMQPMNLLPIKTLSWRDAIKGVVGGTYSVVHEYDDWVVRSPSMTMNVPSVVMLNHYEKPRAVAQWSKEHMCLRDNYTCQYCARVFSVNQLTKDHVVPHCFGGKLGWENLVAACYACNNRRGHNTKIQPMRKPYKPSYYELLELRRQHPIVVPDIAWAFYLMWPEDKVIVRKRKV